MIATIALVLATLPTVLLLLNLPLYRPAPKLEPGPRRAVSVLIPARNEAATIERALTAILASEAVDLDIVVLDDQSTDTTSLIVANMAAKDPRIRLCPGSALLIGWSGKQFACHQLSEVAHHDILLFVDADVTLRTDAIARMAQHLDQRRTALLSGFPNECAEGLAERLIIPMIMVTLLCYLPIAGLRWTRNAGFGVACGQLIMVRAHAYRQAGGHRAIQASRHDGVTLPRAFRRAGFSTDLFDASDIAECRMYQGAREVWGGFLKNATEGMATPLALPVWTVLLVGGHVLPWLLAAMLPLGVVEPGEVLAALAISLAGRLVVALRLGQRVRDVPLYPLAILGVLVIQYAALWRELRGQPARWRDRHYPSAS